MASIGLYFYGARYFDPYLNRWIQPDSIIPGAGDVQTWDRYAAMLNNPVNFIDPTGHMSERVMHDSYGDAECNDPAHCLDALEEQISPTTTHISDYEPDAHILSFTASVGVGGFFMVSGVDILVTGDEVGYFSTLSIGPGLNSGTSVVSQEKEDRTGLTPQFGIALQDGEVYGDVLIADVSQYQGTALIGGASLLFITGEYFSSVDPKTGEVDNNIRGLTSGITFGLPGVGGYNIYSTATYNPEKSDLLTSIARDLGLLNYP